MGDRVLGIIFSAIGIAVLCFAWVIPRYESMRGRTPMDPRAFPTATSGRVPMIDTAVSDASMREIQAIASADDPLQLVGRRIELDLKGPYLVDRRESFWVGDNDHHVLVAFGRGSDTGFRTGQSIHLSGTIQPVPPVPEQRNWGLDAEQRDDLERGKVYILAD